MSQATAQPPFRIASLALSVYVPSFLFAIGQGAVLPIVPLFAKELGASIAVAGLIVALRGIGTLAMDIPGGIFVSRFGDKGAMVAGTVLASIVAVGATFSTSPLMLAVLMMLMGGGWSFWQLARLAYVSEVTPIGHRGRVISLLGGVNRLGTFVGPILGGVMGASLGLESAFYAQAVLGVLAAALMFVVVRQSSGSEEMGGRGVGKRLLGTVSNHREVFATTLIPIVALGALRQGRQIFLPLWGDAIGLDVAAIGLIYGFSYFLDAALFYPVGLIMDNWGRKWAGVPCLVALGIGLILLPLTSETTGFVTVAMLTGIGNGFGSGIVMTLGADLAPAQNRGEFLGVWRLMADIGSAGGPLAISVITGAFSLAAAAVASGGFGIAGGVIMAVFVRETLRGPGRAPTIREVPSVSTGPPR